MDSDDYVHERFVELLYENVIEYQADISVCNYRQFEGDNPSEMIVSNTTCLWSKEQMLSDLSTVGPQNRSVPVVICCNKLIKAELFRGLRFVDKYHEDEYIVNDYIARMGKAVWSDAILYYYRRHTNSITGSERKKDLRHLDVLKVIENRIEIFSGDEYSAVFNKILCSYFENAAVCYFGLKDGKNTRKLVLAIYPQYFKIFLRYMRKLNRRQRLHYALFLLSPSWYRRRYWE